MKKGKLLIAAFCVAIVFCGCSKEKDKIFQETENAGENVVGGNDGSLEEPTDPPIANFTYSGANQYPPCTVFFTNTSSNATTYLWDFGDGTNQIHATNISHEFQNSGQYTVSLKAINAAGSDVIQKTVTVKDAPTKCVLTRISVSKYPYTEAGGTNWDITDGGPDIFFRIYNSSGSTLYTSSTKENISADVLPLTWSFNLTLDNIGDTYYIQFIDEDGILDPNDDMTAKIPFYPNKFGYNNTSSPQTNSGFKWTWYYSWK